MTLENIHDARSCTIKLWNEDRATATTAFLTTQLRSSQLHCIPTNVKKKMLIITILWQPSWTGLNSEFSSIFSSFLLIFILVTHSELNYSAHTMQYCKCVQNQSNWWWLPNSQRSNNQLCNIINQNISVCFLVLVTTTCNQQSQFTVHIGQHRSFIPTMDNYLHRSTWSAHAAFPNSEAAQQWLLAGWHTTHNHQPFFSHPAVTDVIHQVVLLRHTTDCNVQGAGATPFRYWPT